VGVSTLSIIFDKKSLNSIAFLKYDEIIGSQYYVSPSSAVNAASGKQPPAYQRIGALFYRFGCDRERIWQ